LKIIKRQRFSGWWNRA